MNKLYLHQFCTLPQQKKSCLSTEKTWTQMTVTPWCRIFLERLILFFLSWLRSTLLLLDLKFIIMLMKAH